MENKLRIINTARSEAAINKAVEDGYWPLVKPVIPSAEIKSKYAILQDKVTGKIEVINDFRAKRYNMIPNSKLSVQTVIDFTFYYPHQFESPFAAYLVPSDIIIGEMVILIDLIEDVVSGSWNQGDTFRLASSTATWDGTNFILSPKLDRIEVVG